MTLLEIAQIYTDLVSIENQIPESEHISKEEVNALRSKYHQILMDKLKEEGIEFSDRFDAMNKAFELVGLTAHSFQPTSSSGRRR